MARAASVSLAASRCETRFGLRLESAPLGDHGLEPRPALGIGLAIEVARDVIQVLVAVGGEVGLLLLQRGRRLSSSGGRGLPHHVCCILDIWSFPSKKASRGRRGRPRPTRAAK